MSIYNPRPDIGVHDVSYLYYCICAISFYDLFSCGCHCFLSPYIVGLFIYLFNFKCLWEYTAP